MNQDIIADMRQSISMEIEKHIKKITGKTVDELDMYTEVTGSDDDPIEQRCIYYNSHNGGLRVYYDDDELVVFELTTRHLELKHPTSVDGLMEAVDRAIHGATAP